MKVLVQQQLGDKSNYDSSLHDLDSHKDRNGPGGADYNGTPKVRHDGYEPLENLIR